MVELRLLGIAAVLVPWLSVLGNAAEHLLCMTSPLKCICHSQKQL